MAIITIPDAAGGKEHKVEVNEASSEQFAARLRKVAKERRKWARKNGISCYRLYDADLPDYAAAIDIYERTETGKPAENPDEVRANSYMHIAEYAAPSSVDPELAERRFADILTCAPIAFGIPADHVFAKVRRREKGGGQYAEKREPFVFHTQESGFTLEVDMNGYLDTGLFLDHRTTREMVGEMAKGKRFLNLFSYTGSATVHAAGGGAATTTTVDMSNTYLDWAARNMAMNGFDGKLHEFFAADTMAWLEKTALTGRKFDLVFVDPPTFSNSKKMGERTWDVQRDHVALLKGVARVLERGGQVVFSNNLRSFKPDYEELERIGIHLEDITAKTIPADWERNRKIHKCYIMTRG